MIFSLSVKLPSLASKWTLLYVPACEYDGVHANTRVEVLNVAPEGKLLAEYVTVSPSGSVAVIVKVNAEFSAIALLPIADKTGAQLTLFTVIVISSKSVPNPSLTEKRMPAYVPDWLHVGVQVNTLVEVLNDAPAGKLLAEYVNVSPSASVALTVSVKATFSSTDLLPIAAKTGIVFSFATALAQFESPETFPASSCAFIAK
ncbi:MAG: hypothetical protein PHE65_00495 [Candidatus Omnitrophica bacterium]|nr:hypothetical protein [Candidatus Omnitrophota bacterium]